MTTVVTVETMIKDQYAQWQGRPFNDSPPWLLQIIQNGNMGIVPNMAFIHAVWAVKTKDGVVIAEPGDRIMNDDMFGIVVEKHSTNSLTWEQVKPEDETPAEPPTEKRAPPRKKAAAKPVQKTAAPKKKRAPRKKSTAKAK